MAKLSRKSSCKNIKRTKTYYKKTKAKRKQRGSGLVSNTLTKSSKLWTPKEELMSRMIISELAKKVAQIPSEKIYYNSVEEIKRDLPPNKHLYDLIYENEDTLENVKVRLGKPDKIYNHGINKPKSITAGLVGVHIYLIYNNNKNWFNTNKNIPIIGVVIRTKSKKKLI